MDDYLQHLTRRLADGTARLPEAVRNRHADFLLAAQNPDGGFSGRDGGSDLYYTGFALRGLAVLGALTPEACRRAATFLRASLSRQADVVDLFSLLYSCLLVQTAGGIDVLANSAADWPERVAALLDSFSTADGGYARAAGATGSSTYITFLVGLCRQLLGRSLPAPAEVCRFVLSRRRDDGGFVELGPMRKSGTNPTAAAVGVMQLLGAGPAEGWTGEVRDGVVGFLAEMPSAEGGMRANTRIPVADLLSTFTGCWTLYQLGALDRIDAGEALAYAQSLQAAGGGFQAALWDKQTDVEYTFYGLGVLALLAS
jgi:geranylgeranyl transferase type-2 subunit beta